MKKKLTFLGIETSCDETAAAVSSQLVSIPKKLSFFFMLDYLSINIKK